MKYKHLYSLLVWFMFALCSACGQNEAKPSQQNTNTSRNGYSDADLKKLAGSPVPNSMVRNVKKARDGNILIAAAWGGIFQYDGKSFTNLTLTTIGQHRFWDVLEDSRGNLWIATTDTGLYRYDGKSFQHFTTADGLADNRVMKIYEDKAGIIWLGTGGGVSRFDGKAFQNFTTRDGLSNNDITNIMQDKTGNIWFGTRGDACYYDGKTFTVLKDQDGKAFYNVWGLAEDRKGNIWLGNHSLWRYDPSTTSRTGKTTIVKVSDKGAYAIMEDKQGNIWTTGADDPPGMEQAWSLSRYDKKSLYEKSPAVTVIKSGRAMDFLGLVEANDGSIWFGSGGAVNRYDGKVFTDFKSAPVQQ